MGFRDAFSHQEAVKALHALEEGRGALEQAQAAFEDAAQYDEATRPAEVALRSLEELLSDLDMASEPLRERLDRFDEYDRATWGEDG